jgi:hypothetical protein
MHAVVRIQDGGFEDLYRQHSPAVFRLAMSIAGIFNTR